MSGLVAKRMEAQNRLQSNPHDYEARLVLEEVQMKIQNWASVNLKPGQYTGESLVSSFTPKENINSGYQAWARKVSSDGFVQSEEVNICDSFFALLL